MDKKYQVFVSSTFKDLHQTRKKVIDEILINNQFPVGMEFFSAADDDQWEVIKRTIDTSDYYVLILGFKYGSITDEGISYTEMEYEYAKSKGIPILSFVRKEEVALLPQERENNPDLMNKISEFRKKATQNRIVNFWSQDDDLLRQVISALYKSFSTHPRTGWVRGDQAFSPESAMEMSLLSKENRELRIELEKLKQITASKPQIDILANSVPIKNKPLELKINKVKDIDLMEYPMEMDENELGPDFIEEIQEYNSKLPTKETIDKYNSKFTAHKYIKLNAKKIDFKLINRGEKKANEINIFIEFPPKKFLVYSKSDFESLKPPIEPTMPYKPNSLKRLMGFMGHQYPNLDTTYSSLINNFVDTSYSDSSRISYSGNGKLKIYEKSLLHRLEVDHKDEIIIVPKETGEFLISVFIICEEYNTPEEFKFPCKVSIQED
ncbi:DUF4062 domain-containing protein [Bacillus infantis]|uniref:DUF4062 domain-containing protein n=1 Tax=Bacillus infantis TaxID=324767 RepID=UPI003CF02E0E